MNYSKQLCVFVIFASLISSITAMEKKSDNKSYLEALEVNKYPALLQFPSDDRGFPVYWALRAVNDSIALNINCDDKKKSEKAVVCAIQNIFLQLANKKFDVRYLEKVLLGKQGCSYQPTPHGNQYIKSTLCVNEGFSKQITIPQDLSASDNKVILDVMSIILPKLSSEDRQDYQKALHQFALNIMSPAVNFETGMRSINLPSAKNIIEKYHNKAASLSQSQN